MKVMVFFENQYFNNDIVVFRLEKTVWEYFVKTSFNNFRTEEGLDKVCSDYQNIILEIKYNTINYVYVL